MDGTCGFLDSAGFGGGRDGRGGVVEGVGVGDCVCVGGGGGAGCD